MDSESVFGRLFRQLVALYADLVRLILSWRVESYHRAGSGERGEILRQRLSQQIESFSSAEESQGHGKKVVESAVIACSLEVDGKRRQITVISRIWSSLARYFKRSHRGSVLHGCVSEKLKASTWEHVHSALRLARQGRREQARVHAEIATSSLKEAVHYMSEREYKNFSSEIEESLKKI